MWHEVCHREVLGISQWTQWMEVSYPQKIMTETICKSALLMVHLRCQDVIVGCVIMHMLKHSSPCYVYQELQTIEGGMQK